ncbi:MAG TPA: asparagine synthase (glutamine-hydrolyzing) [Terriglobales bacterium]|nr:asparagine synthase (glutamine-hydrolyzing) [Terriglobales bacterium]
MDTMDGQIVHRMNETIVHRGPDDGGVFVGPGIGLGHRRLSIIDVAGGHQPLSNEDGTIWVLLNGEIYNYNDLRADLLARGHRFATNSDTEAIVHLYEQYGESCFERLRGMFAIALWDSNKRVLILARDRVGKKPLFYTADKENVVFGSELKVLLAADPKRKYDVDLEALSDYFSLGYVPAPKTIYRGVRKVLPGHFVVVSRDGLREKSYWTLSFGQVEQRSEDEWCEVLQHLLCDATRVRLMSEVPLGAFLSGGVDSSAVVANMSRLMNDPVVTCSIGFEEAKFDESEYARTVANLFKTNHNEQIVRANAVDIMDKLVWHYDEPFSDSSAVPTYYVSKVARERVTVALGGDGGDESLAGYRRYKLDMYENKMRSMLPYGFRRALFGPLGRWYPALSWAPRVFRGKATFQSLSRTPLEGYFNSISTFRPHEKAELLSGDMQRKLAAYDTISVLQKHYDEAGTDDPLSRIQYTDIKTYLPDDILAKVDRASMAVSLEVRAPLLDHHVIEALARMPSNLKLKNGEGKYIFKKSLEKTLPHDVLYRPKMGFAIPLARWFRKELKELAYEAIFSLNDGILNRRHVEKIWKQHQSGRVDRSPQLWSLLMYSKWKQTFKA